MNKVVSRLSIDFERSAKLKSAFDFQPSSNDIFDSSRRHMIKSIDISVTKPRESPTVSPRKQRSKSPTAEELDRLRRITKFAELRQKRMKSQLEKLEVELIT